MPVVAAHGDSANRVLSRIYTHEYETHCDEIEADPRLVLLHLWGGNVSLRRADYISTGFLRTDAEAWKLEHEDQYIGIRFHQAGLTGVFDRALYAEHRYQRDADSFLRSARTRGAAQWQLHSLFPELLGALDRDWACAGLPGPAGWLVRWVATPERSRYLVKPLVLTARTAHRVRFEGAESAAYRFARRVGSDTAADQRARCLTAWDQVVVTWSLAYNFGAATAASTCGSASAFDSVPEIGLRLPQ
jgi:hypothetical protein